MKANKEVNKLLEPKDTIEAKEIKQPLSPKIAPKNKHVAKKPRSDSGESNEEKNVKDSYRRPPVKPTAVSL